MSKIYSLNILQWHKLAICVKSHFKYDDKGFPLDEFSEPDGWIRSVNSFLIARDAVSNEMIDVPTDLFKSVYLINSLGEKYCFIGKPLYTECDGGLIA